MKRLLCVCVAALPAAAAADPVTDWNNILLDSIRADATNPPMAARAMAMVHVALFDAVNGVVGGYETYAAASSPAPGASPEAAAAVAAHGILSQLYPDRRPIFDAELEKALAGIPPEPRQAGADFGALCAAEILTLREDDNSSAHVPYEPTGEPGAWAPTPPGNLPALLPNWAIVTPFCMDRGDQFRSPGPPPLTSQTYADNFNEVRLLGADDSPVRTPEQTEIALFWIDGPGTATPPGHWMTIAQELSDRFELTLIERARLFALLGMAVCDASIVSWDSKYAFDHWRPITAIREADRDGNPNTAPDPGWAPLVTTPPFPTYTSGHSTFSSAAAAVLAEFFGDDNVPFQTSSEGLPGVHRSFHSLSQAAAEAGRSRIYGGIHFEYDNADALAAGRTLGTMIIADFLRPVCYPDCNADGALDFFDFLCFQNAFLASDPYADCDGDGVLDFQDFLCFQNSFLAGCP